MLEIGDSLPDLQLPGPDGSPVGLRDHLGSGGLVVYFYPRDDTPGCTVQACAFRDQHADFEAAGVPIVGISGDSTESHQAFAQKFSLPFPLLSDPEGAARKAFGVPATLGVLPGRATYVFDGEGKLRERYVSQFRAREHVRRALRAVRGPASGTGAA